MGHRRYDRSGHRPCGTSVVSATMGRGIDSYMHTAPAFFSGVALPYHVTHRLPFHPSPLNPFPLPGQQGRPFG